MIKQALSDKIGIPPVNISLFVNNEEAKKEYKSLYELWIDNVQETARS